MEIAQPRELKKAEPFQVRPVDGRPCDVVHPALCFPDSIWHSFYSGLGLDPHNVLPALIHGALVGCTMGEMTRAMTDVYGKV